MVDVEKPGAETEVERGTARVRGTGLRPGDNPHTVVTHLTKGNSRRLGSEHTHKIASLEVYLSRLRLSVSSGRVDPGPYLRLRFTGGTEESRERGTTRGRHRTYQEPDSPRLIPWVQILTLTDRSQTRSGGGDRPFETPTPWGECSGVRPTGEGLSPWSDYRTTETIPPPSPFQEVVGPLRG